MSFITDNDYLVVIGQQALQIASQASAENRANSEAEAIEEMSSYLRTRYDVKQAFTPIQEPSEENPEPEDTRNRLLVMYTADIALYHMAASMPQKMGMDIRRERYERAVKWLEQVAAGKIVPDLPPAPPVTIDPEPDGSASDGTATIWGGQQKISNNW